ncbi:MAG: hypothetical protein ACI83D_000731 [Planctomycetota bacterium]|jgi:hypothetical protein
MNIEFNPQLQKLEPAPTVENQVPSAEVVILTDALNAEINELEAPEQDLARKILAHPFDKWTSMFKGVLLKLGITLALIVPASASASTPAHDSTAKDVPTETYKDPESPSQASAILVNPETPNEVSPATIDGPDGPPGDLEIEARDLAKGFKLPVSLVLQILKDYTLSPESINAESGARNLELQEKKKQLEGTSAQVLLYPERYGLGGMGIDDQMLLQEGLLKLISYLLGRQMG